MKNILITTAIAVGLLLAPAWRYGMSSSERSVSPDPEAVRIGAILFTHEWTTHDPLAAGEGDGLGPVYNATSCATCHHLGGVGGAGALDYNVTTYSVRFGVSSPNDRDGFVHAFGGETLRHVHPALPSIARVPLDQLLRRDAAAPFIVPRGVRIAQRNTPALFGAGAIDAIPDRVILAMERQQRVRWGFAPAGSATLPVGRAMRLADGHVGRFGWKAQRASLSAFVQAACANELGLGNPGEAQPTPLHDRGYEPAGLDLTLEQCEQITAYVASLPSPRQEMSEQSIVGERIFARVGCADCHQPNLGEVHGIYSDMLLHHLGAGLEGGGSPYDIVLPDPYAITSPAAAPDEWRTPALWGVADSAPYLHDGRAATLDDAIRLHGGQAARSVSAYAALTSDEQAKVIAFLGSLRGPRK